MLKYLLATACVLVWCVSGMAQDFAPDRCIAMDLQWLSTPTINPTTGSALARQVGSTIRMTSRPDTGSSFMWPLRYPIPVQAYSVMVVRYRASSLVNGPAYRDQAIQLELRRGVDQIAMLSVAGSADLVQDGTMHEFRREIIDAGGESVISGLGFAFHSTSAGGRLDIAEVRFERSPRAVVVPRLVQQKASFLVTDANGRPLPDADVRVGLLERANWSSMLQTDWPGRVETTVTLPSLDGVTASGAEAAVSCDGYLTRFLAPVDLTQGAPVEVRLVRQPTARERGESPEPVGQVPDGTVFTSPPTQNYDYSYYGTAVTPYSVSQCAPAWWVPAHRHDRDQERDWGTRPLTPPVPPRPDPWRTLPGREPRPGMPPKVLTPPLPPVPPSPYSPQPPVWRTEERPEPPTRVPPRRWDPEREQRQNTPPTPRQVEHQSEPTPPTPPAEPPRREADPGRAPSRPATPQKQPPTPPGESRRPDQPSAPSAPTPPAPPRRDPPRDADSGRSQGPSPQQQKQQPSPPPPPGRNGPPPGDERDQREHP